MVSSADMKRLVSLFLLLPACGTAGGLDFANSAQYQHEIHPAVAGMTAVTAHVQSDVARGKTREQIAADIGWAALNETLVFLATAQAAAASAPAR